MKLKFSKSQVEDEQQKARKEDIYTRSQWQLIWRKFRKHKLANISGVIIILLYLMAIFAPFLSPYDPDEFHADYRYIPPTKLCHYDEDSGFSLRPFIYGVERKIDNKTWKYNYFEDKSKKYPVYFFVRGFEYKLFGFIRCNIHLFGTKEGGKVFLMGTDKLGRDVFSKVVYGARVSMSLGLIGVLVTFVLGLLIGGISGYYGGMIDNIIQRIIEILKSFPRIPLWMALSAAFPVRWSPITVYFMIVLILSLVNWTGLARIVRGKVLALREEDFTLAAKLAGASEIYIIKKHFIPSFSSYLIASLTLSIPGMILGETGLSFLGIGLRPPIISWGVLLQEAQNVSTIVLHPWLFTPAIFVIITVLSFNFLGDGLRDAADPYGKN